MLCQWILTDPAGLSDAELYADFHKCGRPTRDRSCPWCEEHFAAVFSTPERRAEDFARWQADPRNAWRAGASDKA